MSDFEVSTLAQQLQRHAALRPAASALLAPGSPPINYATLFALVQYARPWLASHGLAPGARVAVLLPAGLERVVSCLAMAACGAVCIPLHAGLAPPELLAQLDGARADAVLGLPGDAAAVRLARTLGRAPLAFDLQQWLAEAAQPAAGFDAPGPEPGDTAFVLTTSGTTGVPKRVPIGQWPLVHSALQTARHLALGPEDRGLCVMPVSHAQGLIVGLLAPLAAGSSVVCAPAFEAGAFLRWVRDFRPTWYTASPAVHHAIVEAASRHGTEIPPHALRLVRSSSSSLDADLQDRLEALWGVPVIQAYGITETAGQLASNPLPPRVRKPGSVGRPVGVELRVADEGGQALPPGQQGAVMARGPSVFEGYEDSPDARADMFQDGWFRTGDLGWFDADGYLFLAGRSKEIINRGGEKISPFEVEQALLRLPGVAQAVAFAVAHPTLGEDVHAAVVPAAGSEVAAQQLRGGLFGVIADFKIPACIHVIAQIPVGAGGKIQRQSLRDQLGVLPGPAPADAPLTPLQGQVAALFAQVLDRRAVGLDANFLAIGGDSLSAARLVLQVNHAWGLDLPASALLQQPTVTTFATALQAAIDDADALSASFQSELDTLSDEEAAQLLDDPFEPR
ncbi:non-ribosomal peptide synthetase [Variovorax sp. J22P271]|uniref:non-ribosomal peptide synthetase n=1 Tax=Variovorax davisae TaxID=3053515 RepID=UPI002575EE27|nr:non-ribosomal peptide synthetase [Variovorax sp. J22P271]MDM0032893.1 non-ribosomal peptide synthetase [Variovorax sp. J22P271]